MGPHLRPKQRKGRSTIYIVARLRKKLLLTRYPIHVQVPAMHSELNFNIGHATSNEFTTSPIFAPTAPSILLFLPERSACSRALFRAKNVVRAIHSVRRRQLNAGEMVFQQGEPGSSLYTVDEGVLDVIKEHGGVSRTVARLSPGEDRRVAHVPVYCAVLISAVFADFRSFCCR